MEEKYLELADEYLSREKHVLFLDELKQILWKNDHEELKERFYTELDFGTGGLRGLIGAGYNRVNPYTIKKATQGLANYINKQDRAESSVAIAYDSRNFSKEFAQCAAEVLAGNGIKVYLFSSLRPVPALSYAVRYFHTISGIVVTASHNPAEYNGYKVYWNDGGQVVPPHDTGIIEEVKNVSNDIAEMKINDAIDLGVVEMIDEELDAAFCAMVKSQLLRNDLLASKGKTLNLVYTPLHGTGTLYIERILEDLGVNVLTVPEQREANGDFPTVEYPNPEDAAAMKMALDLAKKKKASLIMGTDPDADRLGIAVRSKGIYHLISGNQLGSLLANYIFSTRKEFNCLPDKPVLVKTIVTSNLQALIAEKYGAKSYDVLTGFKYIAAKIAEMEKTGESYVFGGEESFGYLASTEVRDKDAIAAAVLTVEMALYYQEQGKTLIDVLDEIYEEFGYFNELLITKTFKGSAGQESMQGLMTKLRSASPENIGEVAVSCIKDYQLSLSRDLATGLKEEIFLPKSNVLQFILEDETIITMRPSGTEPKIKFYISVCSKGFKNLNEAKKEVHERLTKFSQELEKMV